MKILTRRAALGMTLGSFVVGIGTHHWSLGAVAQVEEGMFKNAPERAIAGNDYLGYLEVTQAKFSWSKYDTGPLAKSFGFQKVGGEIKYAGAAEYKALDFQTTIHWGLEFYLHPSAAGKRVPMHLYDLAAFKASDFEKVVEIMSSVAGKRGASFAFVTKGDGLITAIGHEGKKPEYVGVPVKWNKATANLFRAWSRTYESNPGDTKLLIAATGAGIVSGGLGKTLVNPKEAIKELKGMYVASGLPLKGLNVPVLKAATTKVVWPLDDNPYQINLDQ